ncbi:MAG: Abi family protein [Spirochaetaceae bacterium]
MVISNRDFATKFLNKVSYYRFVGYALHYEIFEDRKRTHKYKKNTDFKNVVDLYNFDDKLRTILFDAITHIEVAFRTQLNLHMSLNSKDSHWPLSKKHVNAQFDHEKFILDIGREIKRSNEIFIKNYIDKYTEPKIPASWMLIEVISFGSWSKIYKSLENKDVKKNIANYFRVKPFLLESWVQSITTIRNICAHHGRLWNSSLTIKPSITKNMQRIYSTKQRKKIIIILDIIGELIKPLDEYDEFINKFNNLLIEFPNTPINFMGLNNNNINKECGFRCK